MLRVPVILFVILFMPLSWAGLTNQLVHHPSPYLALHGQDPVQWQDWGQSVLDRAKAEDKLIYISSGYFACHWCHVMQRESYQNPEIAKWLNDHFVPVKIDRELQPALDAHLIDFVQRTRGHAGWPLNVFLTPEGYPLVGLTYAPPKEFGGLLRKVIQVWKDRPEELRKTARTASLALQKTAAPESPKVIDGWDLHVRMVTMALAVGDDMEGGFGSNSRFPMAPLWSTLLERIAEHPDEKLQELIELTLNQMATQGMRDHLGGGFFRYTVDSSWQTPHYEKMLYTQALLSQLFMQAAEVFDRPDYLAVAKDTLDFSLQILKGDHGGFIASLSAIDPFDVEGGGYIWTPEQLGKALTPDELAFAKVRWGLSGPLADGEGYLPINSEALESLAKHRKQTLVELEAFEKVVALKLVKARVPRDHPRDDKQLAAWNGLMLSALSRAVKVFPNEAKYREAGEQLRDYLANELWDGTQLHRAKHAERSLGSAALEDYVFVAVALNEWADIGKKKENRALSQRLVSEAWQRFYKGGGWLTSDSMLIPGLVSENVMSDGPLPSPAAQLIELTLSHGNKNDKVSALQALRASYPDIVDRPIWFATHASAIIKNAPKSSGATQ